MKLTLRSGMTFLSTIVLSLTFAGCATYSLSPDQCEKYDWAGMGKRDIVNRSNDDEFQKLRKECLAQETADPLKDYVNGRFVGLKEVCTTGYFYFWGVEYGKSLQGLEVFTKYDEDCKTETKKSFAKDFDRGMNDFIKEVCTAKKSYEWGKIGGRRVPNCPGRTQMAFEEGYDAGFRIYELNEAKKNADVARTALESERAKAEQERKNLVEQQQRASLTNASNGKVCSTDHDCSVQGSCFLFSCRTTGKSCISSVDCQESGSCKSGHCSYF